MVWRKATTEDQERIAAKQRDIMDAHDEKIIVEPEADTVDQEVEAELEIVTVNFSGESEQLEYRKESIGEFNPGDKVIYDGDKREYIYLGLPDKYPRDALFQTDSGGYTLFFRSNFGKGIIKAEAEDKEFFFSTPDGFKYGYRKEIINGISPGDDIRNKENGVKGVYIGVKSDESNRIYIILNGLYLLITRNTFKNFYQKTQG